MLGAFKEFMLGVVSYCILHVALTMLDVLHVEVEAGHENPHSLRTLVIQQLHHLQQHKHNQQISSSSLDRHPFIPGSKCIPGLQKCVRKDLSLSKLS